jgi:membrane protein
MARWLPRLATEAVPIVLLAGAGVLALRGPQAQRRRARGGSGRGRTATSPLRIPLRGWKDILIRTRKEFTDDEVPLIAAGVAFFTLLALFPGLAAFVALYGLFADVAEAQHHLQVLAPILPAGATRFIGDQMVRLAAAQKGGLSLTFAAGLLTSIWSANGAVKAMMTGLNVAYEEEERRGIVHRTLTSLVFTLGLLVFGLAAITLLGAGPFVETYLGRHAALVVNLTSWPILLVALGLGLALLYRYGPSRDPARFEWISWGSAAALLLWLGVSALFSLYVGNFAHYGKTYGSLGAVIGFMMWCWLSSLVVLVGAELNSEVEHQTAVDTTVGPRRPMGARDARMADTVGAAQAR